MTITSLFTDMTGRKYATSQYKAIKEKAESHPFLSFSVCEGPCLAMHMHPSGPGGLSTGKARTEKAGMHKRPEWKGEADEA